MIYGTRPSARAATLGTARQPEKDFEPGPDRPEVLAPNGDLIVVNGNNGNAVEIGTAGQQLATKTLVKNGAGDLFGLTTTQAGTEILLVNDGTNALDRYHP
jgi:hypothetical protein